MCICMCVYIHICIYIYIYIYIKSPPWINKPLLLIKSRGPGKLINAKKQYQERLINAKENTTWSHLGGDLGGAQKCSGSPGLKKCYV